MSVHVLKRATGIGAVADTSVRDTVARMLAEIEAEARAAASYTGRPVLSRQVLQAMSRVPRHEFVSRARKDLAYYNGALPIGYGQTISQPYIVALMTDLLDLTAESVVLEIGTGSGYQAAVLAEICRDVYSIEIVSALAEESASRLHRLGYTNVHVTAGDGYDGWSAQAPFDGILVTAAAEEIPPPLVEQLKPGARLVIPLGERYASQALMVVEKDVEGGVSSRSVLPVVFVPFTRRRAARKS